MKLFHWHHFLLLAVLTLLCRSGDPEIRQEDIPSTSSVATPQHDPTRPPPVEQYINFLSPIRIARLNVQPLGFPAGHPDPEVPFFYGAPLYNIKTSPSVVEQALRDYGEAIMLDVRRRQARKILYGNGLLVQRLIPEIESLRLLWTQDRSVNVLKKYFQRLAVRLPHGEDVRDLPHTDGIPILRQGTDSLGHMKRAARSHAGKFYHLRPEQTYPLVLIDPTKEVPPSIPRDRQRSKVEHVVRSYEIASKKFGQPVAGLIWGAPIMPQEQVERDRLKGPSLIRYQRFLTTTDRDQMVSALQMDGRFRLYIPSDRGVQAYKVKVKNPGAKGETPFQVAVDVLSRKERAQERLMVLLGKVQLPL